MRRALLLSIALGLAGCVPPLSEIGRPCPCATGWTCCPGANVCVSAGTSCPVPGTTTGGTSSSTVGSTGGGCTTGGSTTTTSSSTSSGGTSGHFYFAPPVTYPLGDVAVGLATGDVDGDGRSDVIAAQRGRLSVLFAAPDGGLVAAASSTALSEVPSAIAAADFDGDGRTDVLLTQTNAASQPVLELWLGNGDGTFRFQESHPISVVANLLGASPKPDGGLVAIAVAGSGAPYAAGGLVFQGDGHGHLGAPSAVVVPGDAIAMALGDLGPPGSVDALIASSTEMDISGDLAGSGSSFAVGYGPQHGVAAGRLVADGGAGEDFVTVSTSRNELTAYLNQGGYQFVPQAPVVLEGSQPGLVVLADVDGDGNLDAVSVNLASSDVGLALGSGDGTFFAVGLYRTAPGALAATSLDVNGDGRGDLLLLQEVCGPGQVQLLLAR